MGPQAAGEEPGRGRLVDTQLNSKEEKRMTTLSRTVVQAAAWAALWLVVPARLWAQGTSPWVDGPASRASIPPPAVLREAR